MSQERIVVHDHEGDRLESVLVTPEGAGPFPGMLLVHEFTGLDETTLEYARRLRGFGFAVLAADFYGAGNRPSDREEARITHRIFRDDRPRMRNRALACLAALMACPEVRPAPPSALGLSFGGGAVLELARSGAALNTVISIYGYLDTTHPTANPIKADIHLFHLDDDPVVPEHQVDDFRREMQQAKTAFTLHRLNNAEHGFMNPSDACFDKPAAEAVWNAVEQQFAE